MHGHWHAIFSLVVYPALSKFSIKEMGTILIIQKMGEHCK